MVRPPSQRPPSWSRPSRSAMRSASWARATPRRSTPGASSRSRRSRRPTLAARRGLPACSPSPLRTRRRTLLCTTTRWCTCTTTHRRQEGRCVRHCLSVVLSQPFCLRHCLSSRGFTVITALGKLLKKAKFGANFSPTGYYTDPNTGDQNCLNYIGWTFQWVRVFREEALTLPVRNLADRPLPKLRSPPARLPLRAC